MSAKKDLVFHQETIGADELSATIVHIDMLHQYLSHVVATLYGVESIFHGAKPLTSSSEKPPLPDELQKPRLLIRELRAQHPASPE